MKEIKICWNSMISVSNELIKNYSKENKVKKNVKDFVDRLVDLSESFVTDRLSTLEFLKQNYNNLYLQATNLMSAADSVAVIMQANEGVNDYLILVNVFRNIMVNLDTLASTYWLKVSELNHFENEDLKLLIKKSNYSVFDKGDEEKVVTPNDAKEDLYFDQIMNKDLWTDIKNLDQNYLLKNRENFEYFKELLISTEDLANDMVINLWAVLAICFSYLDYLNNLLK